MAAINWTRLPRHPADDPGGARPRLVRRVDRLTLYRRSAAAVLAVILAYLFAPVVDAVSGASAYRARLCILLVYPYSARASLASVSLFAPAVVSQARTLQTRLPALLQSVGVRSADVERALRAHGIALPVGSVAGNATGAISNVGPGLIAGALTVAASLGTALLDTALVLVMTFYLINDRHTMSANAARIVPTRYAAGVTFAVRSAGGIIGRYVRAQLLR